MSPVAVEHAREKYPTARFIAADAKAWEPEPESFDIVVSKEVIERIVDKAAYLAVARKALRPGGYLFMTTPNLRVLDAVSLEERKHVWEIQPVELPLYRRQLNGLLESAGFDVIATSSAIDGMGRNGIHRIANSPKVASASPKYGTARLVEADAARPRFRNVHDDRGPHAANQRLMVARAEIRTATLAFC